MTSGGLNIIAVATEDMKRKLFKNDYSLSEAFALFLHHAVEEKSGLKVIRNNGKYAKKWRKTDNQRTTFEVCSRDLVDILRASGSTLPEAHPSLLAEDGEHLCSFPEESFCVICGERMSEPIANCFISRFSAEVKDLTLGTIDILALPLELKIKIYGVFMLGYGCFVVQLYKRYQFKATNSRDRFFLDLVDAESHHIGRYRKAIKDVSKQIITHVNKQLMIEHYRALIPQFPLPERVPKVPFYLN